MILLLVILLIYLVNRMVLNIFLPDTNEKIKINISLLSTLVCVFLYKCKKKIENFEGEGDDEGETLTITKTEEEQEEKIEELEEDIEEKEEIEEVEEQQKVEQEQEMHVKEGEPTEQDEEIKKNIQGDLQKLLDDMVNMQDDNEIELKSNEPKDGNDSSMIRTGLSSEDQKVEVSKKIGETQKQVEKTVEPQAMISVTEEEPRPTKDFSDIKNPYILTPEKNWVDKKFLKEMAVKEGCECAHAPMWGSNFAPF